MFRTVSKKVSGNCNSSFLLSKNFPSARFHLKLSKQSDVRFSAKFSTSAGQCKAYLNRVTVIGGGHMGTGIAQVSAIAGNEVKIVDPSEDALRKSRNKIQARLIRLSKRHLKKDERGMETYVNTIMNRIETTTDLEGSLEECDLVVEAIPEDLQLKQTMFAKLDKLAPNGTVFVTNTSSIPVVEIGAQMSQTRKEKYGGVHFFDAVAVKLVEIIKTAETSDETLHKINEWSQFIGKVPISCKDTPGFIVNRLNIPYFMEAVRMFERGDASIEDIDTAMKLGAGYPFGPFELADYIGIDVICMIFKGFEERFANEGLYKCPPTILRLNDEGKFGRKTGEGFFKYSS